MDKTQMKKNAHECALSTHVIYHMKNSSYLTHPSLLSS